MSTVESSLVKVCELQPEVRCQMQQLLARHFDGVTAPVFQADLAEKEWAILLRDTVSGALAGFTTLVVWKSGVKGGAVDILFSGDTIVDSPYRGSNALARAWASYVYSLIAGRSEAGPPLYWLLLCQGFRTYRFLPLYFNVSELL